MAKNNFKKQPKVLKDEKFWRFTKKSSLEILRSSANLEVKFHDAKVNLREIAPAGFCPDLISIRKRKREFLLIDGRRRQQSRLNAATKPVGHRAIDF